MPHPLRFAARLGAALAAFITLSASAAAFGSDPAAERPAATVSPATWPAVLAGPQVRTHWGWLGSILRLDDLSSESRAVAEAGVGDVDIALIYGIAGHEAEWLDSLTRERLGALRHWPGRRAGPLGPVTLTPLEPFDP